MSDCATAFAPLPMTGLLDAVDGLVAVVIFNQRVGNRFEPARVWSESYQKWKTSDLSQEPFARLPSKYA